MAKTPDELRVLQENWDTFGGRPIAEEAIATAKALRYVPLVDGGLQIELYAGLVELEIEVNPEGVVTSIFWELARNPKESNE
jgi:hypothetical protein